MKYYYSPHTGEGIKTDTPSDWMQSTTTPPPHDGMFFDGSAWYDFISPIDNTLRITEIKAELSAIDLKSIRPAREGDATRLAALEAQAQVLRIELSGL
jgi:hypothetical protein